MKTKKVALSAMFLSLALILGVIENYFPPILPMFPYLRLGLGNIVILLSILLVGKWPALLIVSLKAVLPAVFVGRPTMIMYALPASLVSYCLSLILVNLRVTSLVTISGVSAILHNITQILVASILVKDFSLFKYLSYLILLGAITGYISGLIVHFSLKYIPRQLTSNVITDDLDAKEG